jgi:hypothetical protein
MHPARQRMWSNGIQAIVPLVNNLNYHNLPPIFELVEPIVKSSPAALQFDMQELLIALYNASPDETVFFIAQILKKTKNPLPAVSLRRMSPNLPETLQNSLREILQNKK